MSTVFLRRLLFVDVEKWSNGYWRSRISTLTTVIRDKTIIGREKQTSVNSSICVQACVNLFASQRPLLSLVGPSCSCVFFFFFAARTSWWEHDQWLFALCSCFLVLAFVTNVPAITPQLALSAASVIDFTRQFCPLSYLSLPWTAHTRRERI